MNIKTYTAPDQKSLTINVSGRFDFGLHKEFRDAYAGSKGQGMLFRVNLAGADYMDSSALGMLLLLREHAVSCAGHVVLSHPRPEVKRVLDIARFESLFQVE
jgi:anti-anti-sigma factor